MTLVHPVIACVKDPGDLEQALAPSGANREVPPCSRYAGKPPVWQETGYEDTIIGLAVPDGGGWYLRRTRCRARLPGPPGGKCPACRRKGKAAR